MDETTYTIELTPMQRFLLLPIFRKFAGPFANRTEGKVFRTLHDKLGLTVIGRAGDLNGGKVSAAQIQAPSVAGFVIDFHEAQMFARVAKDIPADGNHELIFGGLRDEIDAIIAGQDATPSIAPLFVNVTEDWTPPPEPPKVDAPAPV